MARKKPAAKPAHREPVRVCCYACRHHSAPGDNSAYCAVRQHRVCACQTYGRLCANYDNL